MVTQIVLAAAMFALLFLLFLVLSKSMGGIDNCFYKLEYLIRKECDLKLEGLEEKYKKRAADKKFDDMYSIRRVSDDEAAKEKEGGEAPKAADAPQKADEAKNKAANGNG